MVIVPLLYQIKYFECIKEIGQNTHKRKKNYGIGIYFNNLLRSAFIK